jgi:glycerol uptake facilitator-like aquaporin
MIHSRLSQRLGAEGLGTGFLLATVIGSGIMAERLAGGNQAIALLQYAAHRRHSCGADHYLRPGFGGAL